MSAHILNVWKKIERIAHEQGGVALQNMQSALSEHDRRIDESNALKKEWEVPVPKSEHGFPVVRMEPRNNHSEVQMFIETLSVKQEKVKNVLTTHDQMLREQIELSQKMKDIGLPPIAVISKALFDAVCRQHGVYRFETLDNEGRAQILGKIPWGTRILPKSMILKLLWPHGADVPAEVWKVTVQIHGYLRIIDKLEDWGILPKGNKTKARKSEQGFDGVTISYPALNVCYLENVRFLRGLGDYKEEYDVLRKNLNIELKVDDSNDYFGGEGTDWFFCRHFYDHRFGNCHYWRMQKKAMRRLPRHLRHLDSFNHKILRNIEHLGEHKIPSLSTREESNTHVLFPKAPQSFLEKLGKLRAAGFKPCVAAVAGAIKLDRAELVRTKAADEEHQRRRIAEQIRQQEEERKRREDPILYYTDGKNVAILDFFGDFHGEKAVLDFVEAKGLRVAYGHYEEFVGAKLFG